jgi:type II secretory pathway component PulC
MFFAGQNVCDLAAIQEIRDDGVIITNLLTKRVEVLTFSPAKPSTGALPPPPAVPAPAAASDIVAIELPKASVDLYLANLPDLLASAVAVPRYRETANGRRSIDGYEIGQVRQGGAVEQMGLRDGDVVLEVNGQPLDGMATVMRILGQIQNMPQAKVTVLRKGQRMTFVFNTK